MVAELAGPGRGWDAVVIGEYERTFCGSQFASMAPLFGHYGIRLWTPEVGGQQRTDRDLIDPANTGLGHRPVQRWNPEPG